MKIDPTLFHRINVVATSGSGKSTFARSLAEILDIEYFEMDRMNWLDNWEMRTNDEMDKILIEATSKEKWVLDGNYNRTQPIKWQNVQTIIWLDYPFYLVFWRMLSRSIARLFDQKPMWGTNNKESFRRSFMSKESIVLWMVTSYPRMKERYTSIFENNPYDKQLIRLKSPKEAEDFLRGIPPTTSRKSKTSEKW